jgi:hypothetical protein
MRNRRQREEVLQFIAEFFPMIGKLWQANFQPLELAIFFARPAARFQKPRFAPRRGVRNGASFYFDRAGRGNYVRFEL